MARSILVVEDEKEGPVFLRPFLRRKGFNVYTAGDCQEALSIIREYAPRVVILDLSPGRCYGGDILEKIPHIGRKYKVIVITGMKLSFAEISRLYKLGVKGFMAKPVIRECLQTMVEDFEPEILPLVHPL